LRRGFPAELIESALAYELDEPHAAVASSLWHDAGLCVKNADFLEQPPPAKKFNLLITNPPYVRHHHLGQTRKVDVQALVRERLHLRISGLAGLYCYFLLLADAWLDDGGLAVWLIPSEFMDVNYGAAVKEYRRVRLLRIHRFCATEVQFDDALVSSAIVIFEKAPPAGQDIDFTLGGSLRCPSERVTIPHAALIPGDKWTKYSLGGRFSSNRSRHRDDSRHALRLGDLFTIKRGLATGNNDFFILPRARAREVGIPEKFLRPILPSPRCIADPVIEADESGYPLGLPQLALIDCRLPEDVIEKRFARFWRYLLSGKAAAIDKAYLTSRRRPWYSQEDRPPPPFLCTYMGRATNGRKPFRFLRNKSQATAHNVYLLLYPTGPLKAALEREPELYQKVFEGLEVIDTDRIKGDGRVYGGGLFKMEPKELASVPADSLVHAVRLADYAEVSRQESLF
jgi:hypothetical protein